MEDSIYAQSLRMMCNHERILNESYNRFQNNFSKTNFEKPSISESVFNGNESTNASKHINECRLYKTRGDNNIVRNHKSIPSVHSFKIFDQMTRSRNAFD